jgi:hypothetical protein
VSGGDTQSIRRSSRDFNGVDLYTSISSQISNSNCGGRKGSLMDTDDLSVLIVSQRKKR